MGSRRNLVLVGFMGTGKTTLGRRVAAMAGRPFRDMDVELELRAGKPIARVFAEDGEAAFRAMESALAAEWGAQLEATVVSCGGGVVLRDENMGALGANGVVVCLTARPEVVLERTARNRDRPLLETQDRERQVRDLLAARAARYAAVPLRLDTSDRAPSDLAAELLRMWSENGSGTA